MPGTHRLAACGAALVMALSFVHPVEAAVPTVADAKAYALKRIGRTQFRCLDAIVSRESSWNPHAGSVGGYYGIFQTHPGSRMGPGWRDDPMVQTRWGIGYISDRYGSACDAWSFWKAHRWF